MVQWLRLHISIAGVLGLTPSWETDILHAGLVWPSKKKKSTLKYIVMELRIPWTARRSNQSILKEIIGRTDVEAEASILWPPNAKDWKKLWCWERLKAGGEGDNRGWDGWMASPTRWTWVWASSGSWWWTGKPGILPVHGVSESDPTEWLNWLTDPPQQIDTLVASQKKEEHLQKGNK